MKIMKIMNTDDIIDDMITDHMITNYMTIMSIHW